MTRPNSHSPPTPPTSKPSTKPRPMPSNQLEAVPKYIVSAVRNGSPIYITAAWTSSHELREAGLFDFATAVGLMTVFDGSEVRLVAGVLFDLLINGGSSGAATVGDVLDEL